MGVRVTWHVGSGVRMTPDYLSHSQVSTWLTCGEKYRLERIERVPQDNAWFFTGGTAVHTATEMFDRQVCAGGSADEALPEAIRAFHNTVDEAVQAGGQVWLSGGRVTKDFPNGEDESWWRANGPNMVESYAAWRAAHPHLIVWDAAPNTPAIELAVRANISDVPFTGFVDRVMVDTSTGELIVVDIKAGQPPKSDLQLALYRLMLAETLGTAVDSGAYYMARKGAFDQVVDLRRWTPDMLARIVRDVYRGIGADLFIPQVSALCKSCTVRTHCTVQGTGQRDWSDDVKEKK